MENIHSQLIDAASGGPEKVWEALTPGQERVQNQSLKSFTLDLLVN